MGEKDKQSGLCAVERGENEDGKADVSGLCGHPRPCDVQALAATEGHVWIYGPAATGVCVNVCSPCYR